MAEIKIAEEWKPVIGNGDYQVSNMGRVRGKYGRIIGGKPGDSGYINIPLRVDRKTQWKYAHRIVAEAFLVKVEDKEIVNHINGIRDDNRAVNLEWVTSRENNEKQIFRRPGQRVRAVVQLSIGGDVIREWGSIIEASRELKLCKTGIRRCCQGRTNKTIDGSRWKYMDDYLPEDPNEEWLPFLSKAGDDIQVSNFGRIKTKSGVITKGSILGGYLAIGRGEFVHRIVAAAFHPCDDEKKDVVNHKDGNKHNNHAANLEWVSRQENMIHARATGLTSSG